MNQTGGTSLPGTDPTGGWEAEESLDLDMVSAICPNCHILLAEASSPSITDLATAENTAVAQGATAVSNSWGSGAEFIGETSFDSAFNHPGVAITAAAGDSGYGTQYPAASPYVTSVGGTSLYYVTPPTNAWFQNAWSGTGSGCAVLEPAPPWQQAAGSPFGGCRNRTQSDVSADADPQYGIGVYDTWAAPGLNVGWNFMGGTSEATALIAGVYALAGPRRPALTLRPTRTSRGAPCMTSPPDQPTARVRPAGRICAIQGPATTARQAGGPGRRRAVHGEPARQRGHTRGSGHR